MQQFLFGSLEPSDVRAAAQQLGDETAQSLATAFRLARMGFAMLGAIERALVEHDLTPSRFRLLMVLAFHPAGASSTSELAGILGVAPASVTGLLTSLEERGLVTRQLHPKDRRRVDVRLTDAGSTLLRDAIPDVAATGSRAVGHQPRNDVEQLLARCDEIHARLTREDP